MKIRGRSKASTTKWTKSTRLSAERDALRSARGKVCWNDWDIDCPTVKRAMQEIHRMVILVDHGKVSVSDGTGRVLAVANRRRHALRRAIRASRYQDFRPAS